MGRYRGIDMKKIMFITGSRGEWGYIRPILNLIKKAVSDAIFIALETAFFIGALSH